MIFKNKAKQKIEKLLECCRIIIKKYQNESDYHSCENDIMEVLEKTFNNAKDEISKWDDTVEYEKIASAWISSVTFDLLASGKYHIYSGMLDPLRNGPQLLNVYNGVMEQACKDGYITKEELREQKEYLGECIKKVG